MVPSSFITACLLTVVAVVSTTEGYFWYGSSSRKVGTERSREPSQQYPGNYRAEQPWAPQYYDSPMTVAVPFAVPISPPMAPVSSGPIKGQPVQLVPCLCPISSRDDQQQQSAFIVSPVPQQQQQQQQHQAPQPSSNNRR